MPFSNDDVTRSALLYTTIFSTVKRMACWSTCICSRYASWLKRLKVFFWLCELVTFDYCSKFCALNAARSTPLFCHAIHRSVIGWGHNRSTTYASIVRCQPVASWSCYFIAPSKTKTDATICRWAESFVIPTLQFVNGYSRQRFVIFGGGSIRFSKLKVKEDTV